MTGFCAATLPIAFHAGAKELIFVHMVIESILKISNSQPLQYVASPALFEVILYLFKLLHILISLVKLRSFGPVDRRPSSA